jgi:hypothetical protein
MKEKLAFGVLYALLAITLSQVNCIRVSDDSENSTTTTPSSLSSLLAKSDEKNDTSLSFSFEVTSEKNSQESRTIGGGDDDDDKLPGFLQPATQPTMHKIPPTLQNVKKVDAVAKEKPEKSIKDIA